MTCGGNTVVARSTNWLIKRTLRRGSVPQMFYDKFSQAMHYHNTLSNTQRRDCRGFKQAACYQDTLSNRHRSDCWNFQGSSAACSNVNWGRHRTPRHLAGKLVFKRMLHLCPFTIRTPATLNRSPTRKWKIEFLESQTFSRLRKYFRVSGKMWALLGEEC